MQIYSFGLGVESEETSAEILGGKGAGLVWMSSKDINVPPGFILPTTCWAEYTAKPKTFMKQVAKEIKPWMKRLEDKFGYQPLVSVRSGARVSCPGMMDTILNVGMEYGSAVWLKKLGDECAINSESRLIEMYGCVVKGLDKKVFSRCQDVDELRIKYTELTKEQFPDAQGQLLGAIEAVFKSWNNDRAEIYRKINNIPDDWGTAVVVQSMVFGNLNAQSGTGVLFTRNPDTGENKVVGEFLTNAQGEDVVDGSHTPVKLTEMGAWNQKVADELLITASKLESLKGDVQDIEFTIQDGELFILQTRNAKRSPAAAVRIATEMFEEKLINLPTVFKRVSLADFDKAQQVVLDPTFTVDPMAHGLPACTGVVTGKVVYTSQAAIDCKVPCILVTKETTPDDIAGMFAAKGIVTMQGGSTCHAAVVARGMNKPCVVGVGLDLSKFPEGEILSIDGATGAIWDIEVPVIDGSKNEAASKYLHMLRTQYDYVPIVDAPIVGWAKEVLYHPSSVRADWKIDSNNIRDLLDHVDRLYVDLRDDRIDLAEQVFLRLFEDADAPSSSVLILAVINNLPEDQRKKITVIGSGVFATGITCIKEIKDLDDLVLTTSPLIFMDATKATEAMKKVLEWRAGELKFANYGELGAPDAKSFISDVRALQLR
jgi:pyruvate,phosphate dikinase